MKTQMKSFMATVLIGMMLLCAGCTWTGDQWQKAAETSKALIGVVKGAQDVEVGFYHNALNANRTLISAQEHISLQRLFDKIAQADKDLNDAILKGSKSQDVTAAFNVALDTLTAAIGDGSLGIKNQTVAASISASLVGAKALLVSIYMIAKGKPAGVSTAKAISQRMVDLSQALASDILKPVPSSDGEDEAFHKLITQAQEQLEAL